MPTLIERIASRLPVIGGARTAVSPIAFHPPNQQYFGSGIGTHPSHQTLLAENIGIADTATRAIANRLASLDLLVKTTRRTVEGTTEDEILDDHPLKLLLDRPHPNYSQMQMLRLMGQYIPTVGEAYLLKVGNRLGVPTELHPIPPWLISPQMSQGVVVAYVVQTGGGDQYPIKPESIVRIYFPDPQSPWTSEGYLGPTGIEVDSIKFAGQHLRYHYQNDATPKTWMESGVEATAFEPEDKERFYAQWEQRYHRRRGSNTGGPAILPFGYTLKDMPFVTGSDITPLLDFWERSILKAFGTPRSILGEVVSGDRSSAETNQYVFDRHTILPIATLIADAFTHQLAPDFDASLFVEFDSFVSDDKHFKLEQETADLAGKVRSINQVRIDRGLDPVEWGELPVGQLGQVPYDGSDDFSLPPDGDGAIDDEEPEPIADEGEEMDLEPDEPRQRANIRAGYFDPKVTWKRVVAREKKYIPSLAKAMRRIFAAQRDDVLKNLNASMPRARITAEELFDPADPRWAKMFKINVDPIREAMFLEILGETLVGLGIEEFIFTDAMKASLERFGAELIKHTGRTTKRRIQGQLIEATEEGEGIGSVAKRIKGVFAERRKNHAVTIARTEVGKAQSDAQIEGFKQGGVEKKKWITSLDDRVRETHLPLEQEVVGINEPFRLDPGELAEAPRIGWEGVELSAANTVNCRCDVSPVVDTK